jgi:hypothetical protein
MLFCPVGLTGPVGGSGYGFASPGRTSRGSDAAQALIRAAKTSVTAGTLCASPADRLGLISRASGLLVF